MQRLAVLRTLGLVGQEQGGAPGAQHVAGHLDVVIGDAGADVDHEQHHVGVLDGEVDLVAHVGGQRVELLVDEPSRIHEVESTTVEHPLLEVAVTRHAGAVVHHGGTVAQNSVKQAGFANVGTSYDGDARSLHPTKGNLTPHHPLTEPRFSHKFVLTSTLECSSSG